jgi:hypothetical protein
MIIVHWQTTPLSHAHPLVLFLRPATRSIILRDVDMHLMLLYHWTETEP